MNLGKKHVLTEETLGSHQYFIRRRHEEVVSYSGCSMWAGKK
jgi:hypothetical protein